MWSPTKRTKPLLLLTSYLGLGGSSQFALTYCRADAPLGAPRFMAKLQIRKVGWIEETLEGSVIADETLDRVA